MNEYFVDKCWKFVGKEYLESKCVLIELLEILKRLIVSKCYLIVVKSYELMFYIWLYLLDFYKDYLLVFCKNIMFFVFLYI